MRGEEESPDNCRGFCELTYAVGMLYVFLISLGLLFVTLKQRESMAPAAMPPGSALFQAFLPFDSGR
jgi:hypothetical protein